MNLLEAVFDPPKAISGESKAAGIKNGFLHPGDEPELQSFANLTHLPQKTQVQHQSLIFPAAKIIQQLVHHHQQPMLRILPVEAVHHVLK